MQGKRIVHVHHSVFGNLHIYYDGDRPDAVDYNGTMYGYVYSLQGDVLGLRDSTGAFAVEYRYDAWGRPTSKTGPKANSLGTINPFRYRGYVLDEDVGLYYLRSRYYNPWWGRFISADSILGSFDGFLTSNVFSYCRNCPVIMVDSDGTWPTVSQFLGLVVAAAVTAVATAIIVASVPAAICTATVSLTTMGLSYATASVIATIGTGTVAGLGVLSIGDSAYASVMGVSPVKELVFYGDDVSYEYFQMAGTMATGGLMYMAAVTPGICFIAGTPIQIEGGILPIEDIEEGDLVWAMDPDTGDVKLKKVVQTFVNETDELTVLMINNEEVRCTPEHPFYVYSIGWVEAQNLRRGALVACLDGTFGCVQSVSKITLENKIKVYNFEVEGYHTYFVGNIGYLVHNSCNHTSLWRAERRAYWRGKGIAARNGTLVPSGLYVLTEENIDRMLKGKAPFGTDGRPVQLHHIRGITNDFYTYTEILASEHSKYYKLLHPWLFN